MEPAPPAPPALLAPLIEHTLLRADATGPEVTVLCREAVEHRFFGVCVSPVFVALARDALAGTRVKVVTVAGFPLGTGARAAKAHEAALAVADGADEVDVVIALGFAREGDYAAVAADVRAVRDAIPGVPLKAILETGYWDEGTLRLVAEAALEGGADFLKTSTGFGPGGASAAGVALLREVAGARARVKASGGIRDRETAVRMVESGAARLGTSSGVAIVTSGR